MISTMIKYCLEAFETCLIKCLYEETSFDLKDFTKEQVQIFFSCMTGGSTDKAVIRDTLLGKQVDRMYEDEDEDEILFDSPADSEDYYGSDNEDNKKKTVF